jgi:large subunit ribosomal protein L23
MALFGSKKKSTTKKEVKSEKKVTTAVPAVVGTASIAPDVIIRPRITEKSGILSQNGIYTFEVSRTANKSAVARTVSAMYKVTPTNVAIINLPEKKVFIRGKRGVVSGVRKAIVTLKKGDKIDFV